MSEDFEQKTPGKKFIRGIDFDLFIIDPKNKDTTEGQLRQSIMQALETLEKRIERLENDE